MTRWPSQLARPVGSQYNVTMSTPSVAVSMVLDESRPFQESRLSWRLIAAWSVGTIGPVTLLYVVNYAFMFFMTDLLGVSAAIAGSLIFAVRIFDIFVDPLMGVISDRTVSRMGRRRPWMLGGSFLSAAGCIALFTLPTSIAVAGPLVVAAWSLAALVLYFVGYSMFNVPYMAMPAEMTDSYGERTRLMGARVFFVALSGLLGVSVAPLLVQYFGKGRFAYSLTSMLMAARHRANHRPRIDARATASRCGKQTFRHADLCETLAAVGHVELNDIHVLFCDPRAEP